MNHDKHIKSLILLLSVASCLSVFPLTGCSQKEIEDVVETATIAVEQGEDEAFDISGLTMEEVYAMTPKQIETTVTKGVKDWRAVFAVSENKVMTEDDWANMKHLLGYSIWGKEWIKWYKEQLEKEAEEYRKKTQTLSENLPSDPNYIYYAPKKSYLANMTDEEYADYMAKLFEYYEYNPVDFHQLTHEQLQELKDSQIEEMAVDDDYYMEVIDDPYATPVVTPSTITVSGDETQETISVEQVVPH